MIRKAEREAKRQEQARTFKAVVADYLQAKQPELRPASFRVSKLYLKGPYFRSLHPMAINTVTRTDVAAAIRTIARNVRPFDFAHPTRIERSTKLIFDPVESFLARL